MKIEHFTIIVVFCSFQASTNGWLNKQPKSPKKDVHGCIDKRPDCSKLRATGWCKTQRKIMTRVCKKSCFYCGECRDKRPDCGSLFGIGYCKSYPDYMGKWCPDSCEYCINKIKSIATTKKPATVSKYSNKAKIGSCKNAKDQMGKARCQYYKYIGWCDKRKSMKYYCKKTCVCDRTRPQAAPCSVSKYGCCWDKETKKLSPSGRGCPECVDDPRFTSLCIRFKLDCNQSGNLAKSLRKYCPKMCNVC